MNPWQPIALFAFGVVQALMLAILTAIWGRLNRIDDRCEKRLKCGG